VREVRGVMATRSLVNYKPCFLKQKAWCLSNCGIGPTSVHSRALIPSRFGHHVVAEAVS